MKKILYLILPLMLLFLFTSCGDKNKIELSYDSNTLDMFVGETVNVKPNVTGENVTLEYSLSSDAWIMINTS